MKTYTVRAFCPAFPFDDSDVVNSGTFDALTYEAAVEYMAEALEEMPGQPGLYGVEVTDAASKTRRFVIELEIAISMTTMEEVDENSQTIGKDYPDRVIVT